MVIKITEKPVISIATGKVLGALKGLIYKDNKVTSLYCEFEDSYFYIPIENAYIGSDAVMLKVTKDIKMFHTEVAKKVYTENGAEVGTVTSIEMNDFFDITGIIVNNLFIEIDKILCMENTIIVKMEKKDMEDSILESTNKIVDTDIKDVSDNQDTEIAEALSEGEIDAKDIGEDMTIEIDQRYNHLCGKKLLEDITIIKETYEKGTLIDAPLIQFAITNNAIVKLIMNTED
ncbi:hypothetical protein CACET_c12920 [Clostridium aceticum]|uniref:Uncharacterized protein n=1 Tax=Clostridium aceticum TaxID=84022 RepID=A0A0D8IC78_9CLOT|nr:hypothetical protein [Clostridium aceticum]AKL94757.1 hypothetical protein CACET_c12920 [Clostridium aceticum]KJF27704.1 hypothetical protein TZ02_03590 [Clostridium aceticum]